VATWSGGFNTSTEFIDQSGRTIRLRKYESWGTSVDQLTKQRYGNIYCEEYTRAFKDHLKSAEILADVLDQVTLDTASTFRRRTGLARQLHQVAKLIKSRELRTAERDLFFVQTGGFDTHGNQIARLAENFQGINDALEDFVAELTAQSVLDSVLLVTHSDFGRTLTSNGAGTDHGWGGNHLIIGGKLNGGQVFNEFLSSYRPGSDYDAGRGRVIPKYPWESFVVPVAEWLGITKPAKVFPNLEKFNSTFIIKKEDLFQA
jgi:cullin-associated NEDD8-dissociated protein 1